ncbi:MAG: hypothetical protein R3A44_00890 [Caldilineaceae bacterium]
MATNWPNSTVTGSVYAVAFSPDDADSGRLRIVSGSADSTVRIWDADSGDQLAQLDGHSSWVNAVAFSPDGQRIVSGSADSTVRIWDADSGDQLAQLDGHAGSVYAVAFSPDGQRIVSGSDDRIVRIWDADSGDQLAQLNGHAGSVYAVAFSPDGQRIVSGSDDRTVRIWDAPERLLLRAIARVSRPAPILTGSERQRFGIANDVALPGQKQLEPLMVQAQAQQLVEQGKALAHSGAITEAIATFESALVLDSSLQIEPAILAQEILRNSVRPLLFAGYKLAREGRLDAARVKFEEAAEQDDTIDLEATINKAQKLVAASLINEGRTLAQAGNLDEAAAKFKEAVDMDTKLDIDALTVEAKTIVAAAHIAQAESLTESSNITETASLLEDTLALVQEMQSPVLALHLCQLDISGPAASAVKTACDLVADWTPTIEPGVPVTGAIKSATGDLWQLNIAETSRVTITLSADDSTLDTYLILYDLQFQIVDENDDIVPFEIHDSELQNMKLTEPGIYWIEARRCCPDSDEGSTGAYRLTVTLRWVE